VPAVPATQSLPVPADLRDFRYGEVIPVFQEGLRLSVEVYNTIGLNDCPPGLWAKLDARLLARTLGAVTVKLNGPRHWVLDGIIGSGGTAAGKVVDFGGIEMRLVAKLDSRVWEGSVGDTFYTPNRVQRFTTWIYLAGKPVYELVSPEGDVFRMQSYAQIADPDLRISDLEDLGRRLALPKGWSYRTRVLAEDSELRANGVAYVINDNLYNSYQKVTE